MSGQSRLLFGASLLILAGAMAMARSAQAQPVVVAAPPLVVERPVVVVRPPVVVARPVYVAPPGVVYVRPTYALPAPGYVWHYHAHYGWGWYHPHYGWHRGWH